jgi:hypothetical protein
VYGWLIVGMFGLVSGVGEVIGSLSVKKTRKEDAKMSVIISMAIMGNR